MPVFGSLQVSARALNDTTANNIATIFFILQLLRCALFSTLHPRAEKEWRAFKFLSYTRHRKEPDTKHRIESTPRGIIPRNAPTYLALCLEISGFSVKLSTQVAYVVRILLGFPNSSPRLVVDTDFEVLASAIPRFSPTAGASATRRCQRSTPSIISHISALCLKL